MKHLGSLEGTQEARVALSYAWSNSYPSFMLSKLPGDMKHLGTLEGTQEARVALSYASSNSYTSFMLSELPACFISL